MNTTLHDFLHHTTYHDLPDEVRSFARQWLLDLIGVAAGGRATSLSRIIHTHAARHFGGDGARMLFDGRAVSPAGAALAGGMTIDALDAHDGHKLTKGHVGCGVFPSLLAMSQSEQRHDAQEFLTALVLGYEIGTRAGIALHRTATDKIANPRNSTTGIDTAAMMRPDSGSAPSCWPPCVYQPNGAPRISAT